MSAHPGGVLTGQALLLTLLGSRAVTFAYGGWLLVVLATARFGKDTGLFAGATETS